MYAATGASRAIAAISTPYPARSTSPILRAFRFTSEARGSRRAVNTKRAFAKVMQDGDVDGCMFMGRLPTKAEAEVIRSRLGILKKREVGELELERLRTQMASFNAQRVDA